jgi:predicted transcriptional regulator
MNTKLVSSIDAVAHSRLVTISGDALLVDVAKLLSDTQISLVVVCDSAGAMVGVITKTNIVQQIGRCRPSPIPWRIKALAVLAR